MKGIVLNATERVSVRTVVNKCVHVGQRVQLAEENATLQYPLQYSMKQQQRLNAMQAKQSGGNNANLPQYSIDTRATLRE